MNEILDTTRPTEADATIWNLIFDSTPADMLAKAHNNPERILVSKINDFFFLSDVIDLARKYGTEEADIIRSISRSLHAAIQS
jgi:hypothetical protein